EMRKYVWYLYEKGGSLVDYRWEDRIMIVDEMRRIEEMEEEVEEEEGDWRISVVEEGNIVHDLGLCFPFEELLNEQWRSIL
uniref:hypothetical protein n=1 Tax=Bacillus altitudinis TaxID=293387 RepID=UPI001C92D539